jgi:hypothetical protein
MGGIEMGICDWLFPRKWFRYPTFRTKIEDVRLATKDLDRRIEDMRRELRTAALNGEEKWFLVTRKKEGSPNDEANR